MGLETNIMLSGQNPPMPTKDKPIVEKIEGGPHLKVKFHELEFLALNLPSSKNREITAGLTTEGVNVGYKVGQIGDWLVIAYRKDMGTVPYDVYAEKAAEALSIVSGTKIDPKRIVVSGYKSKSEWSKIPDNL